MPTLLNRHTFGFLFFTQIFAAIICKNICLNNRFADSKELGLSSAITDPSLAQLRKATQLPSDCLTLEGLKGAKWSKRKKTFVYSLVPDIGQMNTEATTDDLTTARLVSSSGSPRPDESQRSGRVTDPSGTGILSPNIYVFLPYAIRTDSETDDKSIDNRDYDEEYLDNRETDAKAAQIRDRAQRITSKARSSEDCTKSDVEFDDNFEDKSLKIPESPELRSSNEKRTTDSQTNSSRDANQVPLVINNWIPISRTSTDRVSPVARQMTDSPVSPTITPAVIRFFQTTPNVTQPMIRSISPEVNNSQSLSARTVSIPRTQSAQNVQNVRPVDVQQTMPMTQMIRMVPMTTGSGGFTSSMAFPSQFVSPVTSGGFGTQMAAQSPPISTVSAMPMMSGSFTGSLSTPAQTISTVSTMPAISGGFTGSLSAPPQSISTVLTMPAMSGGFVASMPGPTPISTVSAMPVMPAMSGGFIGSLATPMGNIAVFQQTPVVQTSRANVANWLVAPIPSVPAVLPVSSAPPPPLARATSGQFVEKKVYISPPIPRKTTAVYTTQYTPATKTVVYESDNYPMRENTEVFPETQSLQPLAPTSYPLGLSLINTANYIKSSLIEKFLNSPLQMSYDIREALMRSSESGRPSKIIDH